MGVEALEHQTRAPIDIYPVEQGRSGSAAAPGREQRDPLALDLRAQCGGARQAQDATLVQAVDLRLASRPDPP